MNEGKKLSSRAQVSKLKIGRIRQYVNETPAFLSGCISRSAVGGRRSAVGGRSAGGRSAGDSRGEGATGRDKFSTICVFISSFQFLVHSPLQTTTAVWLPTGFSTVNATMTTCTSTAMSCCLRRSRRRSGRLSSLGTPRLGRSLVRSFARSLVRSSACPLVRSFVSPGAKGEADVGDRVAVGSNLGPGALARPDAPAHSCYALRSFSRSLGVQQSRGWVHYAIHRPEPHILLYRRPKGYGQPAGAVPMQG